jgi:hypothetical protein
LWARRAASPARLGSFIPNASVVAQVVAGIAFLGAFPTVTQGLTILHRWTCILASAAMSRIAIGAYAALPAKGWGAGGVAAGGALVRAVCLHRAQRRAVWTDVVARSAVRRCRQLGLATIICIRRAVGKARLACCGWKTASPGLAGNVAADIGQRGTIMTAAAAVLRVVSNAFAVAHETRARRRIRSARCLLGWA